MLNARKRDEELSDFPYIDHIPFPFSYVTRQSNDILETYFMKAMVVAPIAGYCMAMLKYGGAQSFSRAQAYSLGKKSFPAIAIYYLGYAWFTNPWCQFPNRGSNQIVTPEQRFKNYLDEKYPEIYENANKEFYYQMVDFDKKRLAKEVYPYQKARAEHQRKNYEKFILGKC